MIIDRFFRNQDGATAVEFAIVLPLLAILIFGIIEFGLYLFNQHVINNAVREAARAGIVLRQPRICNGEIINILQNNLNQRLVTFGASSPNINTPQRLEYDKNTNSYPGSQRPDCEAIFSDLLTVSATFQYDFLFLSNLGIGPVTIEAVSQMKFE